MRLRSFVVLGLVAAVAVVAVAVRGSAPTRTEYCVAEVDGVRAQIDLEQARWSALMAAIAQRRGLPPRATTIAIATAFQESKIHNIDYGDRDSLGLFQQRPSQGWGTPAQVMDPVHSIGAFYDGLEKVDGYQRMSITDAAQRVQRSAYPGAYAAHEDYARALASTLRGYSPTEFSCQLNPGDAGNASAAAEDVRRAFGARVVTSGDDVQVPLVGDAPDVDARGWAVAHYLVANASHLGLTRVAFDRHVWTVDRSDEGWTRNSSVAADTVLASVS